HSASSKNSDGPACSAPTSLAYAVTFELLGDVGVHRLGVGYIQIALGNRAVALLRKSPAVQRRGQAGIDLQCRVEAGDGVFGRTAFQIDEPAAVKRVNEVRPQPKGLVAILQGRLQIADHGACPATVVESFHVLRVHADRVVEILNCKVIGPLAGVDLSA